MPTFSSIEDMNSYVRNTVMNNVTETVGATIRDTLKQMTDDLLYQSQNPKNYERTYDLLSCIRVDKWIKTGRNTFQIYIYYDSRYIRPKEFNDGRMWNQHMSSDMPYGENDDMSSMIAYWMNYGHGGLYRQKGLGFVEAAHEDLWRTRDHILSLKSRLESLGFIVKFN